MAIGSDSRTFTARWVFPAAGAPLANGTIAIRGETIESVDARGVRTPDEDLGNAAIAPGFVNPHTHLDLSGARGLIPPTDPDHFPDWLRGAIAYRRSRSPEQVQADIRAGLAECLKFGTTLIGDIASEGASWNAVASAKVRAVVYFELIGLSTDSYLAALQRFTAWYPTHNAFCRPGQSPHAPYSVQAGSFAFIVPWGDPATTHLAETQAEADLLERHDGPLVPFLKAAGVWDGAHFASSWQLIVTLSSMDNPYMRSAASRFPPVVLAHCNYLPAETPLAPNQSIVYCPRTHAAFRHPPHPFREFLQRGVRVCLGTDSLASNPDLDILAEARFVHAKYPDFPGDSLLKMITLSGAEALGWGNETGSLEPGKSADFVVVPLPNREASDPHELLFSDQPGERRTMFRGRWRTERLEG